MRMTVRYCLAIAAVLAASTASTRADDPKGFTCKFESGATFSYANGAFSPEKAGSLAFEIGNINPEIQSADLVTPAGTRPLRVVRALNALHFLEVVGEGFLNMTTVYDRDDVKGAFPAVHSRHFGILGQPVVGQYQGFCQAK